MASRAGPAAAPAGDGGGSSATPGRGAARASSEVGEAGEVGGLADAVRSPIYSTAVGLALYGAHRLAAPAWLPPPSRSKRTNGVKR